MATNKDFKSDIEQVKTDIAEQEKEIAVLEATLKEKRKHLETLVYFLETIEE